MEANKLQCGYCFQTAVRRQGAPPETGREMEEKAVELRDLGRLLQSEQSGKCDFALFVTITQLLLANKTTGIKYPVAVTQMTHLKSLDSVIHIWLT